MTTAPIYIGNWQNLDIHTATNLFLYGSLQTPSDYPDRLRSKAAYDDLPTILVDGQSTKVLKVQLDAASYMQSGPGKYAHVSDIKFVQDFFSEDVTLDPGTYTRADLIANYGFTVSDFSVTYYQYQIDTDSSDYAQRAYVFNSTGFVISADTTFVVGADGSRTISKVALLPLDDNFDFESEDEVAGLGNEYFLQPQVDLYNIGVTLDIEFTDASKDAIERITDYDYLADQINAANEPIVSSISALPDLIDAMGNTVAALKAAGTIKYLDDGAWVIYGSRDSETLSGTDIDDILIAGDGNDTVNAGGGNDVIYGETGGNDHINGGTGSDTADYSNVAGGIVVTLTGNGSATVYKRATGEIDYLTGIETIIGTSDSDFFYANGHTMKFVGGDGGDWYDTAGSGSTIVEASNGTGRDVIVAPGHTPGNSKGEDRGPGININPDPEEGGTAPPVHVPKDVEDVAPSAPSQPTPENPPSPTPGALPDTRPKEDFLDDDDEPEPEEPYVPPANDGFDDAEDQASPLILDLGAAGITLAALNGPGSVYWDVDNDGFREASGWIGSEEGLLVIDKNGDGIINNHNELFGTKTTSGFTVLSGYDTDHNNVIDSNDAQFNELKVWVDANSDGHSQANELFTLDQLGITSINLTKTDVNYDIAGNHVSEQSTFTINGQERQIIDAWFAFDNVNSKYDGDYEYDVRALSLPNVRGYGRLPDLDIAMSKNEDLLTMVQEIAGRDAQGLLDPAYNLEQKITDIMFEWAGIADNSSTGRGGNYLSDDRILDFLEVFLDQTYSQGGWGSSPGPNASLILTRTYTEVYNNIFARIVGQTELGEVLGDVHFNVRTGEWQNFTGLDAGALADISTLATNSTEPFYIWQQVVRLVDYTVKLGDLSTADLNALNTAIQNTTTGIDLDDILGSLVHQQLTPIYGTSEDDALVGTSGHDTLYGNAGDDILHGGFGIDWLDGGDGNDTLVGGYGDDGLLGGYGDDTYIYELGHGNDNITEAYNYTGNVDKIVFGEGITLADLTMTREFDTNLKISIAGGGSINIFNQFSGYGGIERLVFADGTIFDLTILQKAVEGTSGNDVLVGRNLDVFPHDIIRGNDGDDTLDGGIGDDRLEGGYGNDTYIVTAGTNHILDYQGGSDKIVFGGAYSKDDISFKVVDNYHLEIYFNDVLSVRIENQFNSYSIETLEFADASTIDLTAYQFIQQGTDGADYLTGINYGGDTNNLLYGGAGNDQISAGNGDDIIDGGAGNNYIDGGSGNDTYIINEGYHSITDYTGNDKIVFGPGYDQEDMSFRRVNDNNLEISFNGTPVAMISYFFNNYSGNLYGIETLEFADNSTFDLSAYRNVNGTNSDETLVGLDRALMQDDYIYGQGGNDTLQGGAGNDMLDGGYDNDVLEGGAGNDRLLGQYGQDTLNGGTGNDRLEGGADSDIYIYNAGDGVDTIYDYDGANDTIIFGAGLNQADMTLVRSGNYDLKILFSGNHVLTIENQFSGYGAIETLQFADNSTLDLTTVSYLTEGTAGNDYIYGIGAGGGGDILKGYAGDDYLSADNGDDTLDGGEGNDQLYGGNGNDTYIVTEGHDTIYDYGGNDTVVFGTNYNLDDMTLERSGSTDLKILFNNVLVLTISNQFSAQSKIETLVFDDARTFDLLTVNYPVMGTANGDYLYGISEGGDPHDTIDGGAGNDYIYGYAGNDTLTGGLGNDQVDGGLGNDTFIYNDGDGVDTYRDQGGNDKIVLGVGFDVQDMTLEKVNSSDLKISFNNVHIITIQGHFSTNSAIETLQFADNSTFDLTNIRIETLGTSETETIYGTNSPEAIDAIYGLEGNDTIYAQAGDDYLYGNEGNDTLYGEAGDDTLDGGAGDDVLDGGQGNDVYIFGEGHDIIREYSGSNGGVDAIHFAEGITLQDLTITRSTGVSSSDRDHLLIADSNGNSVKIEYQFGASSAPVEKLVFADGSEVLLTSLQFATHGTEGNDSLSGIEAGGSNNDLIYGYAGNDNIYGYSGNDVIDGGAGYDVMYGGQGNDTYVFVPGFGIATTSNADYVYEELNEGMDTLLLNGGLLPENTRMWTDGYGSLHIRLTANADDELVVYGYNNGGTDVNNRVERISFGNLVTWDLTQGLRLNDTDDGHSITGSAQGDLIDGQGGNDHINGYGGNDIITGGAGYDVMYGGTGDDTYVLAPGFGIATTSNADYIYEELGEGVDTIRISGGLYAEDIRSWIDSYGSMHIRFNANADDEVVIYGYNNNGTDVNSRVERIVFDTGAEWNLSQGLLLIDTEDGHNMIGSAQNDLMDGRGGNDHINGYGGNDTIIGGAGYDVMYGGAGNDTYIFAPGFGVATTNNADYVYEELNEGADTIHISGGLTPNDVSSWVDSYGSLRIRFNNDANDEVSIYGYQNNGTDVGSRVERVIFDNGVVWNLSQGLTLNDTDDSHSIHGSAQGDIIDGRGGNDNINGYAGNDTITGGAGYDNMSGGEGDDTYIFAPGFGVATTSNADYVYENLNEGTDTVHISGGLTPDDVRSWVDSYGSLRIRFNGSADDEMNIYGYQNNGTDVGSRVERITFDNGTVWNLTQGLLLNDTDDAHSIHGSANNDIIKGNGGNDNINGYAGDDTITGGTGTNYLNGGQGNDSYVWNIGDGTHTISEEGGISDAIVFGAGISANDLRFVKDNQNLKIYVNGAHAFTVQSQFYNDQYGSGGEGYIVEKIVFTNNSTINLSEGLTFGGTSGNDNVYGTGGSDTLQGHEGNDYLYAGNGNDTLIGGTGNDDLSGEAGNDTYVWGIGDGNDTLRENGGADQIVFGAGVAAEDVRLMRSGTDLKIHVGDEVLTLKDQFYTDQYGSGGEQYQIEKLVLADNTEIDLLDNLTFTGSATGDSVSGTGKDDVLYGLGGNDYLYAGGGNDMLIGGTGNDDLNGEAGNDTYVWNIGDGNDTLRESSGVDQIVFGEGITTDDIRLLRSGTDLKIHVGGEVLTIKDQFYTEQYGSGGEGYQIEKLVLADNTEIDLLNNLTFTGAATNDSIEATKNADTLVGGAGNDTLYGGQGDDTYIWNIGDGNDTINETNGADQIVLGAGIEASDIRLFRSGVDLKINIGAEVITVKNHFYDDQNGSGGAGYQLEKLVLSDNTEIDLLSDLTFIGTAAADTINGTKNADTLIGGTGADNLYGDAGDDVYVWNIGDGNDTIYETSGSEVIRLGEGVEVDDIRLVRNGSDLRIYVGSEIITVKEQFYNDQNGSTSGTGYQVEKLVLHNNTEIDLLNDLTFTGTSAAETMNGTKNGDTLIGAAGADNLYGDAGDDVYLWNIGDGNDSIYETSGTDEIRLGTGIEADDIRFVRNGSDLKIHVDNEVITVKEQFYNDQNSSTSGTGYQVEKLVLHDDTEINLLDNMTFTGTSSGEYVYGTNGDNVLYGLDGNDYLYAGGGNDTLIGGAGTDTLYGEGGADVFLFEAATAFSNVDTIGDFSTAQGDAINIADLLTGYDPLNDAITDFVSVRDNGSNTVLSVDRDGAGSAYAAQDIVTINGVTGLDVTDMLLNNNLIAA